MSPVGVALWVAVTLPAVLLAAAQWRVRTSRLEQVVRACHELRGPLTAARLGLELGRRTGTLSPEHLRTIDQELERAGLALTDLAAVRERPGPAYAMDQVAVESVLHDCVEAARPAAQKRGATVRLRTRGAPLPIWGDRLRLGQAVGNLIANAVEHGGGTITVASETSGAGIRIEVQDGGPGLPAPVAQLVAADRPGRARPFTAPGRRRRSVARAGGQAAPGRGRGLAIAAAIVARHGGRLTAAPSERGARLVIELPCTPGRAAGSAQGAASA